MRRKFGTVRKTMAIHNKKNKFQESLKKKKRNVEELAAT